MTVVIRNKMAVEIEPTVPDICTLISAASAYHRSSGNELRFLQGISESLNERIKELQLPPANRSKRDLMKGGEAKKLMQIDNAPTQACFYFSGSSYERGKGNAGRRRTCDC